MSVSVSAVPFMLLYAVGQGVINLTSALASGLKDTDMTKLHLEGETLQGLFNKEFKTVIMDKEVLIKTLEEHGATNITEDENTISCLCEEFQITFIQKGKAPYVMYITYNQEKGLNELVENLGSEYATNAQEISYNKIKERLEKQNLEITEEEVFDDNTIVLTVDLD